LIKALANARWINSDLPKWCSAATKWPFDRSFRYQANHGQTPMSLRNYDAANRTFRIGGAEPARLAQLSDFGTNPGNLKAWYYSPREVPGKCPLVVVLHGCTQAAQGFDDGSGWSALAETNGFAVVYPEQQRANNPNLCFNWFSPGDTRRGTGETLSIAQMIGSMIKHHNADEQRVFITGLSAGGAMTSVMLATYPEKFAGGAILAGLPHGAADSVMEALQQMKVHTPSARTSGQSIQDAAGHTGEWPTISIWHGTADSIVDQSNADAILKQWLQVHGLSDVPDQTDLVDRHPHKVWRDSAGKLIVEEYRITGMGHGVPLAAGGEDGFGTPGAFMLEAGISSTVLSAQAWGLLSGMPRIRQEAPEDESNHPQKPLGSAGRPHNRSSKTRYVQQVS
jgi:poly(hydroxyalkanoate) depolymerase family esterase